MAEVSPRFCECSVDVASIQDLCHVAAELTPGWTSRCPMRVTRILGGTTNFLFRVDHTATTAAEDSPSSVLVRVYGEGTDTLIDRRMEHTAFVEAARRAIGPRLYGTFLNGNVHQFIQGRTLQAYELCIPENYTRTARELGRWHREISLEHLSISKEPVLWTRMATWMDLARAALQAPCVDPRLEQINMDEIAKEVATLQSILESMTSRVVFAHNDLTAGNFIQDGTRIVFVDYDYVGYNYRGWDIGNHFCEWAGFEFAWDRCPNKDTQLHFLRTYLEASQEDSERLPSLYVEVNLFTLASHLLWAVWAVVQAEHSTIKFDYVAYATERLRRYTHTRDKILVLATESVVGGLQTLS